MSHESHFCVAGAIFAEVTRRLLLLRATYFVRYRVCDASSTLYFVKDAQSSIGVVLWYRVVRWSSTL